MKIRYIVGAYTAVMAVFLVLMLYTLGNTKTYARDTVYYNEQLQLITREFQSGKSRAAINEEYDCCFLLCGDEDYMSRMNELQRAGAVIFDYYENGEIVGKVAWKEAEASYRKAEEGLRLQAVFLWGSFCVAGYLLLFLIYYYFIRPFRQLQLFTTQIAKGNLEFPLPMQKHNFFGAFTESFDIMREELKRAKESEYQANKSKKELVAELSHDIKTPVATIKAACEVIQVKESNSDTLAKVSVIAGKADLIDHLVENMFHATLEELQVLKVEPNVESSLCIVEMLQELTYYCEITFENKMPECLVSIDRIRFSQVIDNIMNNAYKYAGTAVLVSFSEVQEGIIIKIRDTGEGVPEEELTLLTEKFYRGSNTKGKTGSGLGLYLSQLFMEQMQGGFTCYNQDGFVVELFVKKA
ncbi:MAG: ATP-binding protein [Lachnospiraceae bacterium]